MVVTLICVEKVETTKLVKIMVFCQLLLVQKLHTAFCWKSSDYETHKNHGVLSAVASAEIAHSCYLDW